MSQESSGPEFRVYHRGEERTKSLRVSIAEDGGAFVTFSVRENKENAEWESRTIKLSRAEVAELTLSLLAAFLSPAITVTPLRTRVERSERAEGRTRERAGSGKRK